jgi:hypothetical protein
VNDRLYHWLRWRIQGAPRYIPVVTHPGRLIIDASGERRFMGWGFDGTYMQPGVWPSPDQLWRDLTRRYPDRVERV